MTDILTFTPKDHRWLSNMAFVDIIHDGITYPATENFYQAMKYGAEAVVFLDHTAQRQQIREYIATLSPVGSKRFSRLHEMNNASFESEKLQIMLLAQRLKYAQEPFKSKLLATGDGILEEGNWWKDSFWGVDIHTRQGANHLGKIIMQVRQELREKEKLNATVN